MAATASSQTLSGLMSRMIDLGSSESLASYEEAVIHSASCALLEAILADDVHRVRHHWESRLPVDLTLSRRQQEGQNPQSLLI